MTAPPVEKAATRTPGSWSWRSLLVGAVVGALALLGLLAVVGAPIALTHRQDLPLEQRFGHGVIAIAARLGAGNTSNPVANNPRAVANGRDAYTGSCAECHGARGDGKGAFGQSTYPPATDLTSHDVVEKSDAELFWITKNGLSFTGMPGFADTYNDQAIWSIVSYLRALQGGQQSAVNVPTPSPTEVAQADPQGTAAQRGAAVYFAQDCQACHGPTGNAPGNLALRAAGETGAIRRGRSGMPAYGTDRISDAQLADLEAYLRTFAGQRQGTGEGEGERERPAASPAATQSAP
jgi:mono/diheme cytochrome c family protein